ncbi:hypothetical protein ANTQUA_LOCUS3535 [Anthophora quadrimaculata]
MAFKDDLLVTASSSGEIKLWKYSRNTLNILESVNIGARITCVSLATVHNNLKCEKEDQSEEVPQEIKREKKFRLKQEVIIEKEGNWDVTAIDVPRKTKKLKKKRNIKDVIPMKQKKKKKKMKKQKEEEKLLKANNAENNVENKTSNRKRKVQLEENNNIPMKKPKKLNETISRTDIVTLKESKTKLTRSKETDDEIPPKRRKKERKVVEESGAILKKKKKKKQ